MAGRIPQRFGVSISLLCLMIPCFFFVGSMLKPSLDTLSFSSLRLSSTMSLEIQVVEEENRGTDGSEVGGMATSAMGEESPPNKPANETIDPSPIDHHEEPIFSSETSLLEEILQEPAEEQETSTARAAESKISCDESERRSDTCAVHGDVRVVGHSSSIILAIDGAAAVHGEEEEGISWKIRPYSRKWETTVMGRIRELTVKESTRKQPQCSVNHTVPGIVFSTGGFLGNFFHDFSDVLIPLFTTARRHRGRVQFLVTDFNYGWIAKYETILRRLSYYPIIDLDRERTVRCFRDVHVGLLSHRELGIDPSKAPNGDSMADFREFLRSCFSLSREQAVVVRSAGRKKKPRLLLINRRGSRSITNRREVSSLARSLGFKVLVAGPEETKNVSRFARTVNSCDVLMGVHGAGLTNMVFLPRGATLVQIVPWGGLTSACRHDFGDPAADMAIRYLEYEVKEEESSLIRQYPRQHPVFTDPLSIHKQGWDAIWSVFLDKQTVKVDVRRLRGVLEEALQLQRPPPL
ncbi:beta-1,2-xylosyltransferase XYXT1-like [Zingiber officinale]|uniref:beta-1,2-xylosyltransferase XYXT1-like n=1 Tax=Zingiber officinale TaxID=94328 RepID=UPI001C4C672D|nr:beta-1,2-xylosyltransferase XYXT1-like [Zingiber officinale]